MRQAFLFCALALAPTLGTASFEPEARASVSIAATFDGLVGTSDSVAVVNPLEHMSQWEDGKIITYTRVKVETPVAGELGSGEEAWVRTRGGVVGKIGQIVDGEAVFTENEPSLLFLKHGPQSSLFVSERAQGQYPIVVDPKTKLRKLIRHQSAGVMVPTSPAELAARGGLKPLTSLPQNALATDVLHERPMNEASGAIAAAFKRLHK